MKQKLINTLACVSTLAVLSPLFAADSLTASDPVELTGTQGKFDFIKIDSAHHRLLASHTGNNSLDVIDLETSKLIKSIPTGAAQGVAIDDKGGRYFVSASKPTQMVIIDSKKLEVTGTVPLPGPVDLDAYYPATNRVFVCNDENPEQWVIDPEAKKILITLTLPGSGMEDLGFDDKGAFLYQNLKDTGELAKIDPKEGKFLDKWPTTPADKPHGLAMVPGADEVLIAGGTGKLSLMSLSTGKILASTDIALKVDEIAYDPGLQRAYCASGIGVISVVELDKNKLTTLAPLTSAPGTHSIAVDPQTHTVWIAFAKGDKAYVQAFTAM